MSTRFWALLCPHAGKDAEQCRKRLNSYRSGDNLNPLGATPKHTRCCVVPVSVCFLPTPNRSVVCLTRSGMHEADENGAPFCRVSLMVSYPVVSYQFWYAPLSLQNGGSMSFNLALHGKSRHLEITDELVVRRPLKQGGYSSNEQRPSEAARKGDLVAGTYPGGEAMGPLAPNQNPGYAPASGSRCCRIAPCLEKYDTRNRSQVGGM